MRNRKGVYFMALLEPCCLLCPEGQRGTSTSITLLQSQAHSSWAGETWKLQIHRHLIFDSAALTAQTQCAPWKQRAHSKLTGYLSWPDRWSSVVTQQFRSCKILRAWTPCNECLAELKWSERVKDLELYLSTWEILEQQSTQAHAYIRKRWKKKPGLSSWNHKKWELVLSSC